VSLEYAPATMSNGRGDVAFRAAAVGAAVLAFFLLSSSWDGLYEELDLPQAAPALATQIGGVAVLAIAFLLWSAPGSAELRRPIAAAGVAVDGGAAAIIAAWLIFRDQEDLGIGDCGTVILIVAAIVLAAVAAGLVRAGLSPRANE
jgi:hypothetical protein